MTMIKNICRGTISAWEMLLDIPLPRQVQRFQDQQCTPAETAAGFVAVGVLTGLVFYLLGTILNISHLDKHVAAFLFAALLLIANEYKDSGRGLRLLTSGAGQWFSGAGFIQAFSTASSAPGNREHNITSVYILLTGIALYFLALHHKLFWCAAIFTAGTTLQMLIATLPRSIQQMPYLPMEKEDFQMVKLLLAVILILLFLNFPGMTIAAVLANWCFARYLYGKMKNNGIPATADQITLAGKIAELITLLCALLFMF